ncbi:hypothetical protein [Mycolicibacterium sp.]|jgi:hypothetical protein|uniref:hypothetical protein n=1 Tax=Mycolicibacterium sp. TaxID=2320850 RepID=UPI0028B1A687|nr:hypothetical protein [Mycolicibacterium sp.]
MQYLENMFRVLVVGLVLGAGLPALFAVGLRVYSAGAGGVDEEGVLHQPHPILKPVGLLIFLVVAVVIIAAVLWVTRSTVIHHFGVDLFPFVPKKK